jgi:hypothetical protein
MSEVFSTLHQSFVVYRDADGSLSWSGQYYGVVIESALPIDDGKQCIVLLDPDASQRLIFENLLCIDQKKNVIWTAKLPSMPDRFVRIDQREGGRYLGQYLDELPHIN